MVLVCGRPFVEVQGDGIDEAMSSMTQVTSRERERVTGDAVVHAQRSGF